MTGHIFADESLFDADRGGPATNNQPDTPDYGGEMSALVYDHGMSAAQHAARRLRRPRAGADVARRRHARRLPPADAAHTPASAVAARTRSSRPRCRCCCG